VIDDGDDDDGDDDDGDDESESRILLFLFAMVVMGPSGGTGGELRRWCRESC